MRTEIFRDDIKIIQADLVSIHIEPYTTEIKMTDYEKLSPEEGTRYFYISFDDETGLLLPEDISLLYKLLFQYNDMMTYIVFYDDTPVAIIAPEEDEPTKEHYICWDGLGEAVGYFYQGIQSTNERIERQLVRNR